MTIEEVFQNHYHRTRITQPELAGHLQVSQSTVHKWISGKSRIPLKHYYAVCLLCGVRLTDFIPPEWFSHLENQSVKISW